MHLPLVPSDTLSTSTKLNRSHTPFSDVLKRRRWFTTVHIILRSDAYRRKPCRLWHTLSASCGLNLSVAIKERDQPTGILHGRRSFLPHPLPGLGDFFFWAWGAPRTAVHTELILLGSLSTKQRITSRQLRSPLSCMVLIPMLGECIHQASSHVLLSAFGHLHIRRISI